MAAAKHTVRVVRVHGGWKGTFDGSGDTIEADSWHGLRIAAAAHQGCDIAEIRLVPDIPNRPVDQAILDAAEAVMNQPFAPVDPEATFEGVTLPRPAVFIFHARAKTNSDGTTTITIRGMPGVEVTVTDPVDGPDAMARAVEQAGDCDPDTVIIAIHPHTEGPTSTCRR